MGNGVSVGGLGRYANDMEITHVLGWDSWLAKSSLGAFLPEGGANRGISPGETKLPFEGNAPLVSLQGSCFYELGPLFR